MYWSLTDESLMEKLRERVLMPVLGSCRAPVVGKEKLFRPVWSEPPMDTPTRPLGSRTVKTTVEPPSGLVPAAGVVGVETVTVNGLLLSTVARQL